MEIGIAEQSWQVFMALFASGCVFSLIVHVFIVSVSAWKLFFK